MEVVTAAEQLFFVTLHLTGRSAEGQTWTATGFIYAVKTTTGTGHFLVTNRHVLRDAEQVDFHFISATEGGQPAYGKPHLVSIAGLGAQGWVGHPDERIDVAVVPLASVFQHSGGLCGGSPSRTSTW